MSDNIDCDMDWTLASQSKLILTGIPRYNRDELARVLEQAVKEGLPGPRDLDAALDALTEAFRQHEEVYEFNERN